MVVDAGNGAAAGFASELFSQLGLNVIPVNDTPDGTFPGRDPEPREDTLEVTTEFLRQHNADLAACFDGDADRVVFLDKEGFIGFSELIAFAPSFSFGPSRTATHFPRQIDKPTVKYYYFVKPHRGGEPVYAAKEWLSSVMCFCLSTAYRIQRKTTTVEVVEWLFPEELCCASLIDWWTGR